MADTEIAQVKEVQKFLVTASDLRELLVAFNGPPHLIRELYVLTSLAESTGESNCILNLMKEFNEQTESPQLTALKAAVPLEKEEPWIDLKPKYPQSGILVEVKCSDDSIRKVRYDWEHNHKTWIGQNGIGWSMAHPEVLAWRRIR